MSTLADKLSELTNNKAKLEKELEKEHQVFVLSEQRKLNIKHLEESKKEEEKRDYGRLEEAKKIVDRLELVFGAEYEDMFYVIAALFHSGSLDPQKFLDYVDSIGRAKGLTPSEIDKTIEDLKKSLGKE